MNANIFEQLGKYGGIGGISLGVFLMVVLAVIKASHKPFSRLFRSQRNQSGSLLTNNSKSIQFFIRR